MSLGLRVVSFGLAVSAVALPARVAAGPEPKLAVNVFEINSGRDVVRSAVEAGLEESLLSAGARVLNLPQDYMKVLEDRKKSIEIRETGSSQVTTGGALGTVQVQTRGYEYVLDYSALILGRGNEKEALAAAAKAGVDFLVVGGAYAEEIPLPPAASAWKEQGYKKSRATLSVQAMSVQTGELFLSGTYDGDAMDFTDTAAGNKALAAAGKKCAAALVERLRAKGLMPGGGQ